MKDLISNMTRNSEYLSIQNHLISCMSVVVMNKISKSIYRPTEVIKAFMIQQVTAQDDIEERLDTAYKCSETGRMLPRFVHMEFDEEGKEVVDIIIIS